MKQWRKSSFCARDDPMCAEIKELSDGRLALRNSLFRAPVTFTKAEFAALVKGIKAGEFDDLTA